MNKKKFAIIGKPISHSLSPILHNYWFKKYNIDASYSSMEIEENEISDVIKKIKNREIYGINVTLPYKKKVIPFLDRLINDAEKTSSVNTVYLSPDNILIGDNTDVFGMQAGYLKNLSHNNPKIRRCLIIGAGGVSPSIIVALQKSNISDITIVNRTHDKSVFLKNKFKKIKVSKWQNLLSEFGNSDLIINATSLGLKNGDDFDVDINSENFKKSSTFIDTIYNPKETNMIKKLKKIGLKTFNGLEMFLYQGQKSFYLWNNINPEIDDELIELLEKKIDA